MNIRIIPMSMEDETFRGKTIEEVQNWYFKDYLINEEKGWYYYAKSGLNSNEGDLLLFQMENKIIASAIFDQAVRFIKPTSDGNHGALIVKDVKVFNPIDKEELATIIDGFKNFTEAKFNFKSNKVDMNKLNKRISN